MAFNSQVDGALVAGEVVDAHAALRRKVPHAGRAVDGVPRRTRKTRRELAGGVDQPARALEPGLKAPRLGQEVPAQDHRSEADATIGAAANRQNAWRGCPATIHINVSVCAAGV